MDNNDSNKSQQTGGLKLMTVFIAVLALHVVVIGGFTVYHLMSGGSSDSDLTTTSDKAHKGLTADGTMVDPSQGDKSSAPTEVATIPATTATPAPAPDATTTASSTTTTTPAAAAVTPNPAPTPSPTPDATASTAAASTVTPAPAPEPTVDPAPASGLTVATPTTTTQEPAITPAPAPEIANPSPQAPTGPIASSLLPPAEPAPYGAPAPQPTLIPVPQSAPTPATSLASGPVHMPPAEKSAENPHEHMKVYTVKITDSYKKIAHKYHISVAQLKEANHIKDNVLHTGQKLYVPAEKSEVAEKTQEKSPTSTLAAAPIVNGSAAPITTGLTSTTTTATVATTEPHHHLYTVVKGDTLTKIAHRYKTTAAALMAANDITDPTKLSIGKKLRIPSSGETRSARATPVAPVAQPAQVQAKTNATTPQLANFGN